MKIARASAVTALLITGLAFQSHAAIIQCGTGDRTAFIGDVDESVTCSTGTGNATADDINGYFGGDWKIAAELEGGDDESGFIGTDVFNATVTHGSWGNAPVGGTFNIGNAFWASNDSAVLSMHIGDGGGDPDHFAWAYVTRADFVSGSGIFGIGFSWDGISLDTSFPSGDSTISGMGLSNFKLWGQEPVSVPEPSIIALFGAGLAGLGFARRRKQRA